MKNIFRYNKKPFLNKNFYNKIYKTILIFKIKLLY